MNLMATGCAAEILTALEITLIVHPAVAMDAVYLEGRREGEPRERVDLSALSASGLVLEVSLNAAEPDLVVELAASVDDGEAEVIAIAVARQLPMATDDRKARRIAARRSVTVVSTPELLWQWQEASVLPAPRMGEVLQTISRRSHYRPGISHPLYEWWNSFGAITPPNQSG